MKDSILFFLGCDLTASTITIPHFSKSGNHMQNWCNWTRFDLKDGNESLFKLCEENQMNAELSCTILEIKFRKPFSLNHRLVYYTP